MLPQANESEAPETEYDRRVRWSAKASLAALIVMIAINAGASYLPYEAMENALLGAAAACCLGMYLVWCVPGRVLAPIHIITYGLWVLAGRFTGDMGANDHISGGFLFAALLPLTLCLYVRTHFAVRKLNP